MADITDRPFSKDYSGLVNQTVIGLVIAVLAIGGQDRMRRARRGDPRKYRGVDGLGCKETWEFGYLYQGRSWARRPSPRIPIPPLAWIKESLSFPQKRLLELRGVDAALYIRFLRGCWWFIFLHTFTTASILLPIHIHFSPSSIPSRSMTRASISSLVSTSEGQSLLWIHVCLLYWITITWIITLIWISHGAFQFRALKIDALAHLVASRNADELQAQYHPHPHPQYPFQTLPPLDEDRSTRGLRLRTVMVANIPPPLRRSEKDLKEYFEYYMSRSLDKPALGVTTSTPPGFFNKVFAFMFNRAKHIPNHLAASTSSPNNAMTEDPQVDQNGSDVPMIERVVLVRKMTELASLLERREDVLRRLEAAHIKLARRTLAAVEAAMKQERPSPRRHSSHISLADIPGNNIDSNMAPDVEAQKTRANPHMDLLIKKLSPFIREFSKEKGHSLSNHKYSSRIRHAIQRQQDKIHGKSSISSPLVDDHARLSRGFEDGETVWDVLLDLPRAALNLYQPLVHLSILFRGKTVPAIDYYTAKLNLLTSLITENRARAIADYDPVSTAFVTFADPADARRACRYLAVHPKNPLACMVTMAPQYEDLDWIRIMKTSFRGEFVKDWVVSLGVWLFTVFWLFPVSILVGLVSIDSISKFFPALGTYLDNHQWEEDLIQSFLPTILVSLLSILVPLILLLIAKKAHTITTLSSLHDTIMTRYYKFLIVNVLVFFCIGTAALQTVLNSVKNFSGLKLINIIAQSFSSAGPFYVGWLIFTMAIHGGFELSLFGLPLFAYPSTKLQVTPRKRFDGIRPRTFNYYYWLPNHMLVLHVLLLFSLLNPLVLPFGILYYSVERTVIHNQLLHVYAKNYELNGQTLLVRIVRYSLDGLTLTQVVFFAYMIVLKKKVNVALAAVLIIVTPIIKIIFTRIVRVQFERDDIIEANILCNNQFPEPLNDDPTNQTSESTNESYFRRQRFSSSKESTSIWTWRMPEWLDFSYSKHRHAPPPTSRRRPIPFTSDENNAPFSRLDSPPRTHADIHDDHAARPSISISAPAPLTETEFHQHQLQTGTRDVVRHPPPVSWDDEPNPDTPYDNPYYTRPITNALWLPRNPCGVLDLDDTIDLRKSLTTDAQKGELGVWLSSFGQSVLVHSPTSLPSALPSADQPSNSPGTRITSPSIFSSPTMPVDGTEDIILPEGIAERVYDPDNEEEVENSFNDSAYYGASRRRRSNTRMSDNGESMSLVPLRNKQSLGSISKQRSISAVRSLSPHSRQRRASVFSGESGSPSAVPGRTGSMDVVDAATAVPGAAANAYASVRDPSSRPDLHAQAEFTQSSRSVGMRSAIGLGYYPTTTGSRSIRAATMNVVSAQEAVEHEVIAEEQVATAQRLKQEEGDAKKTKRGPKSWLTSWAFAKAPPEQE